FHSIIGVGASFEATYRSTSVSKQDQSLSRVYAVFEEALLVSVNLHPSTPVPVGANIFYRRFDAVGNGAEGAADAGNTVGGGVYYTGRDTVVIGAEVQASLESDVTLVFGSLRLWYYWD